MERKGERERGREEREGEGREEAAVPYASPPLRR